MAETRKGFIKWFRGDGTGYVIEDNNPSESLYIDSSVVKQVSGKPVDLKKGQKVKFKSKTILGRKVAVDVEPV